MTQRRWFLTSLVLAVVALALEFWSFCEGGLAKGCLARSFGVRDESRPLLRALADARARMRDLALLAGAPLAVGSVVCSLVSAGRREGARLLWLIPLHVANGMLLFLIM